MLQDALDIKCVEDVTQDCKFLLSSNQEISASLIDENTETFWQSGNQKSWFYFSKLHMSLQQLNYYN